MAARRSRSLIASPSPSSGTGITANLEFYESTNDGGVLKGKEAIQQSLEAGPWQMMSIASDTVRVFGNTAVDVGTVRMAGSGGHQEVSHYLVVLRRGVNTWKINSLAVVPETGKAKTAD